MSKKKFIHIRGAREHNLKNIYLDLPREKLTVITGVSGSGKSSLAFDTIYAEGQRRYVESLSAYARQFLEMMKKPDVDQIEGLSPAISIEQKTTNRNPRSTVGTVTEIYDYLRLLFARIGIPYSPATGLPIQSQTVSQMVDKLLEIEEGTRFYLLAPLVRGRKGEYRKELLELQKQGFQRVKIDGNFYEISDVPPLDKKFTHDIDVVIDRLAMRPDLQRRLSESLETCLRLGKGLAVAEFADKPLGDGETRKNKSRNETHEKYLFSQHFSCPVSGFTIAEIEPRLFSFNNPFGACPQCEGLGLQQFFLAERLVPNENLSIKEGAIKVWSLPLSPYYLKNLAAIQKRYPFKLSDPWHALPEKVKKILLYGSQEVKEKALSFEGIIPRLERLWRENTATHEFIAPFAVTKECKSCSGFRLRTEALYVKILGLHIGQVASFSIEEAQEWFKNLAPQLNEKEQEIARTILKEIRERLQFLQDVGLSYLTLARGASSLSGGESQRIRLASQIGSGLTGVLYVLDEPSIGLHQRDNMQLLNTLQQLRDRGNTVLVVEHDEDAILTADYVVDIGPGAGTHGGEIIAQGSPQQIIANPNSLTGQYLSGHLKVWDAKPHRKANGQKHIKISGATGNNLKNIDVALPLGVFTAITGVSGGGKSTFLIDTLFKAASREIMGSKEQPAPYKDLKGLEHIDKVIDIDQTPIGRTPRSNPATYIGVFTLIREWFASLPAAKARGYSAGRFSFNVKGGRCENCRGDGVIKVEMHFLPDVYVTCDVCEGKRYNRETLEVSFKNKTIADILNFTVEEALDFFSSFPAIRHKLASLQQVGLGYIKIGQQATTLSGGEAQRIKLAKELARKATGKTLYILDEPTTGLHFQDIAKLLEVLHELVNQGNTVIVIEHNLDVIKSADWIIDFGPEGGGKGGQIVATGTPAQIAACASSYTGQFLKKIIEKH